VKSRKNIHMQIVLERERVMKCRECKQEREGGIVDKIALCHACYINIGGANE
jgi:hypothetical protein